MAGLAPAIHLPHMASLVAEKGLAHRIDPGDDGYVLGFLPNSPPALCNELCADYRRVTP